MPPFNVYFLAIVVLFSGCARGQQQSILSSFLEHGQVLIVKPIQNKKSFAVMSAWENNNSHWVEVYTTRVVLGRNGLAPLNVKEEGDGYSPSGVYPIGTAFGYSDHIKTNLDYRQAINEDFWVDDIKSLQYNQWVHGTPQASSFEQMRRKDNLYSISAVIEYNTHPVVPGKGSAIFLHVWRAYYKPTAGCIAASQRNLRKILAWLDKDKDPVIVLMP